MYICISVLVMLLPLPVARSLCDVTGMPSAWSLVVVVVVVVVVAVVITNNDNENTNSRL